jgi:hypothetical protein
LFQFGTTKINLFFHIIVLYTTSICYQRNVEAAHRYPSLQIYNQFLDCKNIICTFCLHNMANMCK